MVEALNGNVHPKTGYIEVVFSPFLWMMQTHPKMGYIEVESVSSSLSPT
jgi:hypothetical protein